MNEKAVRLCRWWQMGVWLKQPKMGAIVVTGGKLAISLLSPAGFMERRNLEERNPDAWTYHRESPLGLAG